jgi:hypothetical protein
MARLETRRIGRGSRWGIGLGLLALTSIPSCGGADGSLVDPCKGKLECGQSCDASTPCGSGRYCGSDKTCTAQCVLGDSNCGNGVCDSSGHCQSAPQFMLGGGTSGTDPNGVGGNSTVCAGTDITLEKQIPTVLLLVDQSASMNAKFGVSDRWQTLRTALMDPTAGIVNTLQAQVRFGLSLFSGRNGAPPCPELTNVAPALNNFAAIDAAYPVPTTAIIDDTPTGESIDAASMALQAVMEPGQKVIVLATDGEPDTCKNPDSDPAGGKEVALTAAENAFKAGVFTFYISVGNEVSDLHATQMANVGQGYPRTDAMQRFYRANNQMELGAAFTTIVNGVRSCAFPLNGMVKKGGEASGTVTLNGAVLPLGDPNGWRLSSPSTIELQGTACDTVKNVDKPVVHASFPCGTIVPIIPK